MVSCKNIVAGLASLSLMVRADKAPEVDDSPEGAVYVANFDTKIVGEIKFSSTSDGTVWVDVDLENLPSSGGPFLYHVHEHTVPADGNCTGTLAHLDPYNGNKTATEADELEVGDLSGRHGKLNGTSAATSYEDNYISLNPSDPAYIGNLSVTVHFSNETRIACANITEESAGSNTSWSSSSSSVPAVSSAENGADALASVPGVIFAAAAAAMGFLI